MNTTGTFAVSPVGPAKGMLGTDWFSGVSYTIAFSVGLALIFITMFLAYYFCTRPCSPAGPPGGPANEAGAADVEAGLDEATLKSYVKVHYSDARLNDKGTTASCCSVCLEDYKDTDVLRLLPDCGHLFHLDCVDTWLRLHPSCPVCRTSPLPSPHPSALAEVDLLMRF